MICAIIDIGSNTMRMSVYKIEGQQFSVLLSKKETAGLANYVSEGEMSEEGIGVMIAVLRRFCISLEYVNVDTIHAFATASLRNITNSGHAMERIRNAIGLEIELISGAEEASLSFSGAVSAAPFEDGCLFDLGGGSTEIVAFDDRHPYYINSMEMGCLNLYKGYVEKICRKDMAQEAGDRGDEGIYCRKSCESGTAPRAQALAHWRWRHCQKSAGADKSAGEVGCILQRNYKKRTG